MALKEPTAARLVRLGARPRRARARGAGPWRGTSSPTRSAITSSSSSSSHRQWERLRADAAATATSASSATCRSSSRRTAPTSGRGPTCSSSTTRPADGRRGRAAGLLQRDRASSGATRSTDWEAHAAEKFAWWIARMQATTDRVDLVRLDHFRGFEAYWEVPAGAPTAADGRWVQGPGDRVPRRPCARASAACRSSPRTWATSRPRSRRCATAFDLPGMRILQFAFGDDAEADDYLPHNYIPPLRRLHRHARQRHHRRLVHRPTGRHRRRARAGRGRAGVRPPRTSARPASEIHWDLIRLALASVADTAIVPLQDVLGLGSEARMNVPGRAEGNWGWRFRAGQFDAERPRPPGRPDGRLRPLERRRPRPLPPLPRRRGPPDEPVGTASNTRTVAGPPDRGVIPSPVGCVKSSMTHHAGLAHPGGIRAGASSRTRRTLRGRALRR